MTRFRIGHQHITLTAGVHVGKTVLISNETNFRELEQRAMAQIEQMKADTPDPLEDILDGVEGEERTRLKQLTFGERYGLVKTSKEPTSGTTHKK